MKKVVKKMAQDDPLRRRAELHVRGGRAKSVEKLSAVDCRVLAHELQVHQVELEMQNEELQASRDEVSTLLERYTELYDFAPVGYCTIDKKGTIRQVNLAAALLLGTERERLVAQRFQLYVALESRPVFDVFLKAVFANNVKESCEVAFLADGDRQIYARITGVASLPGKECHMTIEDVSARRLVDAESDLLVKVLNLLNSKTELHKLIRAVAVLVKDWSSCEAVGIRLREGNDYPYYEALGFDDTFLKHEDNLCLRDSDGQVILDDAGSPILECMCGNILRGRFDPGKPFFTANGSFWTNSTTALLASTTTADRRVLARNRCNGAGYESVALIPLRNGVTTFGLIQINDRRKGRFTADAISFLEKMSAAMALAMTQQVSAQELQKSQALLEQTQRITKVGGWDYDVELKKMVWTKEVYGIYGVPETYDPNGARGDSRFYSPEDRRRLDEAFQRCIEKGKSFDLELRFTDAGGRCLWIRATGQTEKRDGMVARVFGNIMDITELHANVEEIRRLSSFPELNPNPIMEISRDGRVMYANAAARELLDQFHLSDPLLFLPVQVEALFKLVEVREGVSLSLDKEMGGRVFEETFYYVHESESVRLYAVDITERKRMEDALRESEERFRALAEDSIDTIMRFDSAGRHLYVNPVVEQQTGIPAKEFIGKTHAEMGFPGDLVHLWEEAIQAVFNTRNVNRVEFKLPTGIWIDWLLVPEFDHGGNVAAVVTSARDITERKRLEEEAIQHKEDLIHKEHLATLGTLVAGVAHEINNPNHIIAMNCSVLQGILKDLIPLLDDLVKERGDFPVGNISYLMMRPHFLKTAESFSDASQRIAGIVSALKDFATPEGLAQPLVAVSVNAVVAKALELLTAFIRKRTHKFSVVYGEDLPVLPGARPRKLEQVVVNLVMNSCLALTGTDKAVRVLTSYEAGSNSLVITVEDEGCGIPEDILPRIKEPFFTTRRAKGGTGLGLSISDSIVAEHHGRLDYESKVGVGTTVRVMLPVGGEGHGA